jgi:RNA polymerase sigma factor (sigma-70 family)
MISTQHAPHDTMDAQDPDALLLAAYAAGDPEAARTLASRFAPRILAQALRLLADRAEAEDVTQDALMRLWKIAPVWREGEAKVSTWLYRVTMNLCLDRLRQRRPNVALDDVPDAEGHEPPVADALQDKRRLAALSAALAALPERQAKAVSLRHLEGLSNPEIAAIMDITTEAVESLTARGKRALAAILAGRKAELGYEDD